jgi:transposase
MIGRQPRDQETIFVMGSLGDLVPEDHILKRVDRVLDLGWLRDEVRDSYCEANGRPSIDPQAAVRLMLAGFFQGVVEDRKLLREAQVNVAIRWFAGYALDERLPDHSSLTRIRQRWGPQRFRRIFERTVKSCVDAGLVSAETVHIDATLIRADVSWESISAEHAGKVLAENEGDAPDDPAGGGGPKRKRGRPRTRPPKVRKRSRTDPDCTLTTSSREVKMQPCYKQHTAVDDGAGVIVDVEVSTGEASEGHELLGQIERVEEATGESVKRVTADAAYAHSENYRRLEERGTEAVIPPQPEQKVKCIPLRRFKYDGRNKVLKCPRGRRLERTRHDGEGWLYSTRAKNCKGCSLRGRCLGGKRNQRTLKVLDGYEALLRARRKRRRWGDAERSAYNRHRWKVEGVHGEEKELHGLRRAVRRRLGNVAIQAYLAAAVVNLKRLAAALAPLCGRSETLNDLLSALEALRSEIHRQERISFRRPSLAA